MGTMQCHIQTVCTIWVYIDLYVLFLSKSVHFSLTIATTKIDIAVYAAPDRMLLYLLALGVVVLVYKAAWL